MSRKRSPGHRFEEIEKWPGMQPRNDVAGPRSEERFVAAGELVGMKVNVALPTDVADARELRGERRAILVREKVVDDHVGERSRADVTRMQAAPLLDQPIALERGGPLAERGDR